MDKEQATEDLVNEIAYACVDLVESYCGNESGCADCLAKKLADAGFAKADKVREETAQEILQDITAACEPVEGYRYSLGNLSQVFARVFGKYGVEVNE